MSLSEYIKQTRHFDGPGMGDQDLEQRAKALEDRIAELEQENQRLQAFVREYDLAAHGHAMPSWLDDARKTLDAK